MTNARGGKSSYVSKTFSKCPIGQWLWMHQRLEVIKKMSLLVSPGSQRLLAISCLCDGPLPPVAPPGATSGTWPRESNRCLGPSGWSVWLNPFKNFIQILKILVTGYWDPQLCLVFPIIHLYDIRIIHIFHGNHIPQQTECRSRSENTSVYS